MELRKKIIITCSIIISIIILTVSVLFITYQYAKIPYNRSEKGNVQSEVVITRSEDGVPLITVQTREDISYSLGYIHAQDRLNLMEYQRALATGTVSQFITNSESELLDRLASIIGFTREADILFSKLDNDLKLQISKYADGVNRIRHTRHLATIGKNDWTSTDVLAILIMKEWAEAFLANTELLFPFNETKKAEILKIFPSHEKFYFYSEDDSRYLYILQRTRELIETYIGNFNNGLAVHIQSSMNSSDERSFTAFSYNADYGIYPGWYPVKIRTGKQMISAITYNGLPFIFTFKKDDTFFTHFSINADSQDFLLFSTRKNNNTYQYNYRGVWREFQPVRIPDGTDRSLQTLRWVTEKGPILSDLISSEKQSDQILAVNSVHPGPGYLKLLSNAPFENDEIKLRSLITASDATIKGYLFKTGKKSYKMFSGFTSVPDPGKKIITNASRQYKTDHIKLTATRGTTGVDYIGSDLTTEKDIPGIRSGQLITNSMRLNRLLSLIPARKIFNEDYIHDITSDTRSGAAEKFVPLFSQILVSAPLTSAKMTRIYYNEWDYTTKQKLQAPAIFYTTLTFMMDETFRDEFGNDTDTLLKNSYLLYDDFYQICFKNVSPVFDNVKTAQFETRETIFDTAFLKSMRYLNRKNGPHMENWRWGELNKNYFKIPNITSTFYSRFFITDAIPSNGAPDSLYNTTFTQDFVPVTSTALTGLMSEDRFTFRMNYTYSSSIFSDFFYGTRYRVRYSSASDFDVSYKTVISPF